jgi:hypothetical protein
VVFGLLAAAAAAVAGEVVAFPGAEGFGRLARGGRGGDVYHVTNLDDAGPGSLREGVRAEPGAGPRTVVFDVSGTIELKTPLRVGRSFLTIAGQSAPGDGVCLKGRTFEIKKAEHVVVRYIRMRLGDEGKTRPAGDDGITTDDVDHLIFDHVSASWGIDGIHDLRRGGNFTLQWSIYAEALNDSLHQDGHHAMLASFRDLTGGISIHHNLLASSRERHPTLGGSPRTRPDAVADFRNNVVYNLSGATNIGNCRVNLVGNLYRPGPDATKRLPIALKAENPGAPRAYLAGNLFEGAPALTADNFAAIDFTTWAKGNYLRTTLTEVRSDAEFDCGPAAVRARPAGEVLDLVLESAGASIRRDAADARIVRGVRDRTHRLIDSQAQVGGWPALAGLPAPADADRDGMPDAWEAARGLDPRDPADRNADPDGDGYTNLEDYLNGLCPPDAGPRRAQP